MAAAVLEQQRAPGGVHRRHPPLDKTAAGPLGQLPHVHGDLVFGESSRQPTGNHRPMQLCGRADHHDLVRPDSSPGHRFQQDELGGPGASKDQSGHVRYASR